MLSIWKTIEVNGRITAKELRDKGIRVSEYAEVVLKKVKFSKPHKVDLIKITVRKLGFGRNTTTEKIYAKAKEMGLELCEAEVAPYLRLDYLDQPINEWVYVAMKNISDPGGDPRVFGLYRRAGGVWLEVPLGGADVSVGSRGPVRLSSFFPQVPWKFGHF